MCPLRSPLDDGFSASISARDLVYHVGVSIASMARGAPILPGAGGLKMPKSNVKPKYGINEFIDAPPLRMSKQNWSILLIN
jgi:hypothetical protein